MSKIISWDSCIFLAWFKKEADKPLDVIGEMLEQIKKREATLLVVLAEVQ